MANLKGQRVQIDATGVNLALGAQNTVEFWMYWRGVDGVMPFGWSNYDLYFASGGFGFNTNNGDVLGIPSASLANKWVHVAGVFYNGVPNATNVELYIDGVKQVISNRNASNVNRSVTNVAWIGGFGGSGSYLFNGYIRNFRIWNRKLSAAEISLAMNTPEGLPEGNGLIGQWYTDSIENVAPQYDYAFASGYTGWNPPALMTGNTSYPFDDNGDLYAGFMFQWDTPIRFTQLKFRSHVSYPMYNTSIYIDNLKIADNITITGTYTTLNGNWYGKSVTLVRKGASKDQTIQQVEFYGDVLSKGFDNSIKNVGSIPAWYTYNMQLVQIDNTLDVIGDTGHGGNDIWHMTRATNIGGAVRSVRSYQVTGWRQATSYPDCYDYNPFNGHLYTVHNEEPFTMYKYLITKNGMSWSVSLVKAYSIVNNVAGGDTLNSWAGVKFALNKQTNDGYAYVLANHQSAGSIAKLYRIKLDTDNVVPEFVTDIPWYFPNNLCSFAVTDDYVFLPTSTGAHVGAFGVRDGHLANAYPIANNVNSYFNASSYNYDGETFVTANGYQYALTQLKIGNRKPNFNDMKVTPATLARQDYALTGSISHIDNKPVSYKVFVNGVEKVSVTTLPSPIVVNHLLMNKDLEIGINTVTVEAVDSSGSISVFVLNIAKINTDTSLNLTASTLTCHKENVALEVAVFDAERDMTKFQILINGAAEYPESGFTENLKTPYTYIHTIRNSRLSIGDNLVTVNVVDEFGSTVTKSFTIKKFNAEAKAEEASVRGQMLYANITDRDGDAVRYKILVNGNQVYPPTLGTMTQYLPTPINVQYRLPKESIIFGNVHEVKIVMEDDMGVTSSWVTNPLIEYAGLMFVSENNQFYSTDIGEVLRYLEVGTVVAGNTSGTFKVFLKNTVGYKVKNIILTTAQKDLDPVEEKVQLSLTDKPFTPTHILELGSLEHGEQVTFYVRISTSRKAIGGGFFDVRVVGDPA
ncbi:LamG domain-containing protein [Paenibacillus sp. TSA_86.1]|uniref:LamG domain-containing protein n=1 Tax=Paenibacillus sp. TSA_86.1 TaxID=3415649 RepID=UPI004046513A